MSGPQFITAAEAARRLGVHKATMSRWCQAGKVPGAVQTLGGTWRVRVTWVTEEARRLGIHEAKTKSREGRVPGAE